MHHFGFPLEAVVIFFSTIALSVYLDLFQHRKSREISVKDATQWTVFWIALAMAFYGYLWLRHGKSWADMYLAGYVLEKTLSVDNLMVFMAIFSTFGIKHGLQHRILYWGIVGALAFRAIFVLIGSTLFFVSPWVGFVFAGIVAWTGVKMLRARGEEEDIHDYSNHWSVQLAKKIVPIFPRMHLDRFFITAKLVEDLRAEDPTITVKGRSTASYFATPAFLCLIAIETSDVMFAFDSVPVVIAVTEQPLLVYAAMIFAILGLRSLYFVLAALARYLVHLDKAVIALLFFIAAKLALQSYNHVIADTGIHISANTSLLIVMGTLGAGVVASLLAPRKGSVRE